MNLKRRLLIIEVLALTSLISVGFSSWCITIPNESINKNGTINVENIINNNDYVSITSINQFKYFDTGFLVDGSISETATLTANIVIHSEKCNDLFSSNSILSFSTILKYSDGIESDFEFIYECLKNITVTQVGVTTPIIDNSPFMQKNEVVTTFDVDISSGEDIEYIFVYTFKSTGFDFLNEIFPYLENDNIQFDLNSILEEKIEEV